VAIRGVPIATAIPTGVGAQTPYRALLARLVENSTHPRSLLQYLATVLVVPVTGALAGTPSQPLKMGDSEVLWLNAEKLVYWQFAPDVSQPA
jgi:hypothetical protein